MTEYKRWNELIELLFSKAIKKYRSTVEYDYIKKQQEEINMIFRDNLTRDQRELIEECFSEMEVATEHETAIAYPQGLKDGVWVLKNLGVLA